MIVTDLDVYADFRFVRFFLPNGWKFYRPSNTPKSVQFETLDASMPPSNPDRWTRGVQTTSGEVDMSSYSRLVKGDEIASCAFGVDFGVDIENTAVGIGMLIGSCARSAHLLVRCCFGHGHL